MFILFKKRDFSSYISDTFAFFKTFGKHFFKNYFIINGGFLLILCVLLYFIIKVYFEVIFSASGAPQGSYFQQYFDDNLGLFIGSLSILGILIIVLSLLNVAFPIVYLKLLSEKKDGNFTTADIILALKQNTGKLLKFFLGSIFVIMPILVIVLGLVLALCLILIGFPLLMIVAPACMAWLHLSLYTYLTEETSFFQALKDGFSLLKQQFWPIIGATFVIYTLIQVIQSFLTMIPYFIGIASFLTSSTAPGWNTETGSSLSIFISIFFIFAILLSYFFNNLVIVNQGIIYYSLREENENLTTISEIDLIGTDNE
jgi:hypothetical protein